MQKVVITTARPLSAPSLKKLKDLLTKKYGKDLEYVLQQDASVLGGARVLVGTQEIDATVSKKLEMLRNQLMTDA